MASISSASAGTTRFLRGPADAALVDYRLAPIIGDLLAEFIMTGKPPMNLSPFSPARSPVQATAEDALRADGPATRHRWDLQLESTITGHFYFALTTGSAA